MKYILVIVSFPDREGAEKAAEMLVEKRLAACCQIVSGVRSIYRWKGKVESADEALCFIKTRENLFSSLEKAVCSIHPYEVPEIVAIPLCGMGASYGKWLDESVTKNRG